MRASAMSLEGHPAKPRFDGGVAPHGPKGLWQALAAAAPAAARTAAEERAFRFAASLAPAGKPSIDLESTGPEVIDLAGTEAALSYLANATFVRDGELVSAKSSLR